MKIALKPLFTAAVLMISSSLFSQAKKDSLGLPGDNFDLYGALELFKQAKSPEAFEKAINSNDNEVNNLDLNADGKVDYVKVIDKSHGDSHSLVLQVAVSKTETQDVAVIETEKNGDGNAHVQIVGDEELYGKDYIIEPKDESVKSTNNAQGAKTSAAATDDVYNNSANNNNSNNNNYSNNAYANSSPPVVVNVWGWPSVQYMYGPSYIGWNSPYYWGYYPGWWQPWQPIYYPIYYRRVYRYHYPYFYRTSFYRCNNAHNYYYGQRSVSPYVRQSNRNGYYREQQRSYSNNPASGGRYNNAPANGGRMNVENRAIENRARQNNERAQPQNGNRSAEPQRAGRADGQPVQNGKRENQQRANPGSQNSQQQGANAEQRRNTNAQPQQQRANQQPREANPQPRPQMQNTQRPAERSQPAQRGAPEMNRGGGGSRGGGGGNRGGGGRSR